MSNSKDTALLRTAIEHTILKADCTSAEVEKLCMDAAEQGFAAVCVPPYYLDIATDLLAESTINIATVIGFPMGYQTSMSKFEEAEDAISIGADHLDVVMNIAAIKSSDWDLVANEMDMLTRLAHRENKVIKFIAETGLLNEIELDLVCKLANDHGIDYLKTSTGFNGGGATVDAVRAMRKLLQENIRIKASGGIRTREAALEMLAAGANRIGTSSGIAIIAEPANP